MTKPEYIFHKVVCDETNNTQEDIENQVVLDAKDNASGVNTIISYTIPNRSGLEHHLVSV